MIRFHRLLVGMFTIVALSGLLSLPGHAEITLDDAVGPNGPLAGPDFMIPADVGEQLGANLFHGFGVFNINTGERATLQRWPG